MAVAYVQSKSAVGSNVSSLSVTFDSSTTSGNLVATVVSVYHYASLPSLSSVTDNKSNTHTSAVSGSDTDSSSNWVIGALRYAKNITGGASHQVTATLASTYYGVSVAIVELSGADTSAPLDGTNSGVAAGSSSVASGTVTPSAAGMFVSGVSNNNVTDPASATAGWTDRQVNHTATTYSSIGLATKASTSGSGGSDTWTISGSGTRGVALIANFKQAGGTTAGVLAGSGTGTATIVGAAIVAAALSASGSGTATVRAPSPAALSSSATGSAAFGGTGVFNSALSAGGVGTGAITGASASTGALSASGTGTAAVAGAATASSVLSSSGTGTASVAAAATAATVLTGTGTGTATFAGGNESALTATGTSTATFTGASTAATTFSSSGLGTVTVTATGLTSGALSSTATGTGAFAGTTGPPADPSGVAITTPVTATFYRAVQGAGDIFIVGTYTGSPTSIEASFNGGAWTAIDVAPAAGMFRGTLSNQAGGIGTLSVRFSNSTGITASIDDVGVVTFAGSIGARITGLG